MVMNARLLTLCFRRKPGQRAIKVYVSVRLRDQPGPKQLHLAYLPGLDRISRSSKRRLEQRLRDKWRQYLGPATTVAIDWVASQRKWRDRNKPKRGSLDRDAARKQLRSWQFGAKEKLLPHFGGPKRQTSEITAAEFHEMFMQSHQGILDRLRRSGRSIDPAEVATWWEQREAPRLLCCFHRLAARRPALRFGRAGLLRYLAGNITRGFAAAQFLREHAGPAPCPLTDSEGVSQ
jgi:hypothetical protein